MGEKVSPDPRLSIVFWSIVTLPVYGSMGIHCIRGGRREKGGGERKEEEGGRRREEEERRRRK